MLAREFRKEPGRQFAHAYYQLRKLGRQRALCFLGSKILEFGRWSATICGALAAIIEVNAPDVAARWDGFVVPERLCVDLRRGTVARPRLALPLDLP